MEIISRSFSKSSGENLILNIGDILYTKDLSYIFLVKKIKKEKEYGNDACVYFFWVNQYDKLKKEYCNNFKHLKVPINYWSNGFCAFSDDLSNHSENFFVQRVKK